MGVCVLNGLAQSTAPMPSERNTVTRPATTMGKSHIKWPSPLDITSPMTLAYFDPDSLGVFASFRIPDTVQVNNHDYRRYGFSERFTTTSKPVAKSHWYIDSVFMIFAANDVPTDPTAHLSVFLLKPYIGTTNIPYALDQSPYFLDSTKWTADSINADGMAHGYMAYFTKHHKALTIPSFFVMLSTKDWGEFAISVDGDAVTTGDQTGRPFDTTIDRSYWIEQRTPENDSLYFGPMANGYTNADGNLVQTNFVMIAFLSDPAQSGVTAALMPDGTMLEQNSPNAATGVTSIGYNLAANTPLSLKLYNAVGTEVKDIFSGTQGAGHHVATVDVSSLPNGFYYYILQAGGKSMTRGLVVKK